jgi:hypothetical protein
VRKSLHQLHEYNAEQDNSYLEPVTTLAKFEKNWSKYTAGLSAEELADMEQAREKLKNYEKIYSIFEYATDLNDIMFALESKISTNNPSNPLSIYRHSRSTRVESLLPDIEKVMAAYYSLIDDCESYPEWKHKVELDLGGTVSYLALTIDDTSREALV